MTSTEFSKHRTSQCAQQAESALGNMNNSIGAVASKAYILQSTLKLVSWITVEFLLIRDPFKFDFSFANCRREKYCDNDKSKGKEQRLP